jgi:hypothetical protein
MWDSPNAINAINNYQDWGWLKSNVTGGLGGMIYDIYGTESHMNHH